MHFTEYKRMKMLKAFKESNEVKLQKIVNKYHDFKKNMIELRKEGKNSSSWTSLGRVRVETSRT